MELLKRGDSQGIDMAKKFYDLPILESNKNNLKNIVITKER